MIMLPPSSMLPSVSRSRSGALLVAALLALLLFAVAAEERADGAPGSAAASAPPPPPSRGLRAARGGGLGGDDDEESTAHQGQRIDGVSKRERKIQARKKKAIRRKEQRAAARKRNKKKAGAGRVFAQGGGDDEESEEMQVYIDSFEVVVSPLCGEYDPRALSVEQKANLEMALKTYFELDAVCAGQVDGVKDLVVEEVEILNFEAGEYCFDNDRDADGKGVGTDTGRDLQRRRNRNRSSLQARRRLQCRKCGARGGGTGRKKGLGMLQEDGLRKLQAMDNMEMEMELLPPSAEKEESSDGLELLHPRPSQEQPHQEERQQEEGRRLQTIPSQELHPTWECPVNLGEVIQAFGFPKIRYASWALQVVTVKSCDAGSDACSDPNSGCCAVASWCSCPVDFTPANGLPPTAAQAQEQGAGGAPAPTTPSLCSTMPYSNPNPVPNSFVMKSAISSAGFCGDGAGGLPGQKARDVESYVLGYLNALLTEGGCIAEGVRFDSVKVIGFQEARSCFDTKDEDDVSVIEIESVGTCVGEVCIHKLPAEGRQLQEVDRRLLMPSRDNTNSFP